MLATVRAARERVAGERGFALMTALIILFVMALLTAASIAVATQTSTSATRDNNVKAELEAAEAGLHIASYRLSQLTPSETQCINEKEAVEAKTTEEAESQCKDSSESLGNGASFRYWTTLPLTSGKCAGRTVEKIAGEVQRCVTSEGKVNGVEPAVRLQTRVTATTATTLFPVNGLVGLERVEIANNAEVKAKGATNGTFNIGTNASVEAVALGKSAPEGQPEGKGSAGSVTREAQDFSLAPVNPGNSATENSNLRIENGSDPSSGISYSKETRTLELGKGELELGGEIYNLCNFTTESNATIKLKAGGKVRIYIDSPNDPGSKCKAGDGKFRMANNSSFENPPKDPTALQIYVYDNSGGTVEFNNNSVFYGVLYAPNSTVYVKNNAEFVGAVAGKVTALKNNGTFRSDKRVEGLTTGDGSYQRSAWGQCSSGSGLPASC